MVDYSKLSESDLEALVDGNYDAMSEEGLSHILGGEQAAPKEDDGFSAWEMVKNVPSSAGRVASGVWDAVTSPIDTVKAVSGTATGALYNANQWLDENTPDALDFMGKPVSPFSDGKVMGQDTAQNATAFADFYKNRYGSMDKALNTLEQDPVGAMLDASAVTGITGGLARRAGMTKAADALRTTSAAVNPINAALNTGKVVGGKLVHPKIPPALYQSSAKFGTTLENRPALIDRALKEKLMPTEAGVTNLSKYISDAQKQVLSLIDDATASGTTVNKGVILRGIKQLKDAYRNTPEGEKAIAQIDDMAKQFLLDDLGNKQALTPADLQRWKVKAYDKINYNAKRNVDAPVKEEVLKTTARAAKNEIEKSIPDSDIKGMNARQGELLELQAPLQRSANRIANRNLISIDTPLKVGTGSILGQALDAVIPGSGALAGAALGGTASILGNPKVKAWMAIQLEQLRKTGDVQAFIRNNPHLSQAEVAAYVAQAMSNASPPMRQDQPQSALLGQ